MFKTLSIDTVRRTITLVESDEQNENRQLELNRSEYNLLLAFFDSHGLVMDKQTLIDKGWPGRVVGENSLAVAIMKLRKKLDTFNQGLEINNLPGEGYIFINSQNIEFRYEDKVSESIVVEDLSTTQVKLERESETVGDSSIVHDGEELESPQQATISDFKISNLVKKPMFWEVSLGIIIGAVMFYFLYREAFECFDCFGGVGG